MNNRNLFAAIHAAFPTNLSATAIEAADNASGTTLKHYTWQDIDEQTARIANLQIGRAHV